MSSISLGVAALVAIDSFAANVQTSIAEQSKALLGGDLNLRTRNGFTPALDSLLDSLGAAGIPSAKVQSFGSMAIVPRTGATRLSQVRAVSEGYPFYGEVLTEPAGAWASLHDDRNAFVDPSLMISLGAQVGDTLAVGFARFVIRGRIVNVPGDPGIAGTVAPRIFIPGRYLAETQLTGFGSRVEHEAVVRLPEGTDAALWVTPFKTRLDSLGVLGDYVTLEQGTGAVHTAPGHGVG